MNLNYLHECQRTEYARISKSYIIKKSHLSTETQKDCYLLPLRRDDDYMMGIGGVVDRNYHYLDSSSVRSGGGWLIRPVPFCDCSLYVGKGYRFSHYEEVDFDEVVYCGPIYNHWGHFLIDFSTRLWYVYKYAQEKKCVFIVYENEAFEPIANIKRFFELLGIDLRNILFVNNIVKCKSIIIPEPSYCSNSYYSDEYLEMFDIVARNADIGCLPIYDKVYFTRNQFAKAKRSEIGEDMLLDFFQANNFKVFCPERLTLDEQIALMRNSKVVAGISGTITHNFLFAEIGTKQKFFIINKTYILNMMQMDINQLKQLDYDYIDAFVSPLPVSLGVGPFLFAFTEHFSNFICDTDLLKPKARYMNTMKFAKNYRFYRKLYRREYIKRYHEIPYVYDASSVHFYQKVFLDEALENEIKLKPVRFYEKYSMQEIIAKVCKLMRKVVSP